MAASGNQGSRWGTFLSQAAAGVEARLDRILAEEEGGQVSNDTKGNQLASTPGAAPSSPSQPPSGPCRTAGGKRPNDRLQERLARAVAAKNASQRTNQSSPRQSLEVSSRRSSESGGRPSTEQVPLLPCEASPTQQARESGNPEVIVPEQNNGTVATSHPEEKDSTEAYDKNGLNSSESPLTPAMSLSSSIQLTEEDAYPPEPASDNTALEHKARDLEKQLEDVEGQHQDEVHSYIERIDALESKLQYLARETSESARKTVSSAPPGALEKKLAEKDQQIAQLMEEGKNLAVTERKHRVIIKTLRTKAGEDEKELKTLKAAKEKADVEAGRHLQQAQRVHELEKANSELRKKLEQAERDSKRLQSEVSSRDETILQLNSQLLTATRQTEAMASKAGDQNREKDGRRIADLEETVASLRVEKNLLLDRAKAQANEWKEKAERTKEHAKALELEMKAEVQAMESKLEVMRIRAEEASSGAGGDTQAKLLRQIETLHTQYTTASNNWQGIEATLLARIANFERDRDEAVQREAEMRKKAREVSMRAKRTEEELEECKTMLMSVSTQVSDVESLRKLANEAQAALAEMKSELEAQKKAWKEEKGEKEGEKKKEKEEKEKKEKKEEREGKERKERKESKEKKKAKDTQSRLPTERRGWLDDLPAVPARNDSFRTDSLPASPLLQSPQRTYSSDFLSLQSLTGKPQRPSAASSISDVGTATNRTYSRSPTVLPFSRPSLQSGNTNPLFTSTPDTSSTIPPTVSTAAHLLDRDADQDGLDRPERCSSPQQVLHDVLSVSTVAAGPSVQLVERMSAAIRRLESEKVASREELARISKQRDEARAEIVALMREVDSNKAAARRIAELEADVAEVNARYETTLELLGEKSEIVEELRADVEDVKAMYRDLVETTVK